MAFGQILSVLVAAATLVNCAVHQMDGKSLAGLALITSACVLVIWFPERLNQLTPVSLIAAVGWFALLTLTCAINYRVTR